MINDLIKLANHFDKSGLYKEANFLDRIIKKFSEKSVILPIMAKGESYEEEVFDEMFGLLNKSEFNRRYRIVAESPNGGGTGTPCDSLLEIKQSVLELKEDGYTKVQVLDCSNDEIFWDSQKAGFFPYKGRKAEDFQ